MSWTRRRALAPLLAIAVTGGLATGCGGSGDDSDSSAAGGGSLVINSFGGAWGEAIELGFVEDFERETGIDVELRSTADPAKTRVAVERGSEPPEDLLDADYATAKLMSDDGLVEPIDYSQWKSVTVEAVPELARQEFGVGWGAFGLGLCYDKRKFPDGKPQPATWAEFWDVERFPGDRGLLAWTGAGGAQPELGLIADGTATDALYPLDIDRGFAKLDEIAPHVPKFSTDAATLQQQLLDGEVAMEMCFTHRVQKLVDGGAPIGISVDQAMLQSDYFVVPKGAPNRENAMRFLAFIMEAKPQAKWSRIGITSPVNEDALDAMPDEVRAKVAASGSGAFYQDVEYLTQPSEQDPELTNYEYIQQRFEDEVG